jgi:phosphoglycerate dehydrogenase-like enzyme
MIRIAVLDDYAHIAGNADWGSLTGSEVVFFDDHVTDPDTLVERLRDFDVVQMVRERTPLPGAVLEALPRLRLLSGTGGRQPHVDMETANRLGILVTGTGGANDPFSAPSGGDSTLELTWGLILALTRHIAWEDHQIRQGHWQTRLGAGLGGKTLGILGMGRIGTKMATVAKIFGMQVIAWGPTLTEKRATAGGARYVSWDELFSTADILSIHVPLTDLSRGWITARELGLMKASAYLINTSRGPIVQQQALLDALRGNTIAGAALDVYDEEPLPANHPILELENVVLTPHLGYASTDGLTQMYRSSVGNINAFLAGEPVNVLNPDSLANARK